MSFESALREAIQGEVYFDLVSRGIHATDGSHYQRVPACVVVPRDEHDCAAALRLATEHGMPLTARGGGTSLAGQTFNTGMVLDFSKYMDAVLEVNADQQWARVQPGAVRDRINAQFHPLGAHFAPDPATSSRCTVGGMIGNNSAGTRSIIYGKTVDNILEMRLLLADGTHMVLTDLNTDDWSDKAAGAGREAEIYRSVGEIIRANRDEIDRGFPKTMRRGGGYLLDEFPGPGPVPRPAGKPWNLSKLVVGSEGTLGLVLEAKIKLVPNPVATAVVIVHFMDVIESLRHVPAMLEHGPSTVELLDDTIIPEARINPAAAPFADFFEGDPTAVQIVEFMGQSPDEAVDRAERFAKDMQSKSIGYAQVIRTRPDQIRNVWEVRKTGIGLATNVFGSSKPLDFVDDAAIPVEHLAEYMDRLIQFCRDLDTRMSICCHSSVGVLHAKPMLDLHTAEDIDKMRRITNFSFEMVQQYAGSWVGEHGDGLVRGEFVERFFGPQLYKAFRQVKTLFDPTNLMNPGIIIDSPPMTQNLRYGTEYRVAEVPAQYHYREQGGFPMAVEQCVGLGACRKVGSGTMCPSYMATRDEEASTRGRANALRLAMSGQLGEEGLTSDRLYEVLDLCLECKACKSECPSAVDMAKLKSDTLQMRYDEHGTPLSTRMVARSPELARHCSGILAPIVNAVQSTPILKSILGIDRRRSLPKLSRRPLRPQQLSTGGSFDRQVVLFLDTFTLYYEPHIAHAAVELLSSCGFGVQLADVGCCQRPRLSKGLLRAAKRYGEKTLKHLNKAGDSDLPIVCLEPSCASALADDLPDLIDDHALGKQESARVHMIDAFLAEAYDGEIRCTQHDILIHGHCHQKALFGTKAMHQLLARNGQTRVHEVDSGCCGMAGSFGYEHHDLSRQIGEQRLFPAVREHMDRNQQGCVVACGFSCRHQVNDFCGIRPKHFVEVVRGD